MSKIDLSISDLYHYIEMNPFNYRTAYIMMKELKEKLGERRQLKYEEAILRTFNTNKQKLLHPDYRKILLAEVGKTYKKVSSDYEYRVYSEDELKEKITK